MKFVMILSAALCVLVGVSGCSTVSELDPNYQAYLELQKVAIAKENTPLLRIKAQKGSSIKMDGVDVFEVYAPVSNTAASANTLQYAPPRNEYLNLLNTVVGVVGTVGGVVAGGKAASSLATAVGNAAGQGYKYIQSPQANQSTNTTTTSTYTLGGSGVLGSGAYTDTSNHSMMLNSNNPVTSTTTTTNPYVGLPTTK